LFDQCVMVDAHTEGSHRRARIDCRMTESQPPIVVRELFRQVWSSAGWPQQAMGFKEWRQLASLAIEPGGAGSINLPGAVRAYREGHLLELLAATH